MLIIGEVFLEEVVEWLCIYLHVFSILGWCIICMSSYPLSVLAETIEGLLGSCVRLYAASQQHPHRTDNESCDSPARGISTFLFLATEGTERSKNKNTSLKYISHKIKKTTVK
jgi:hypothetical protein